MAIYIGDKGKGLIWRRFRRLRSEGKTLRRIGDS